MANIKSRGSKSTVIKMFKDFDEYVTEKNLKYINGIFEAIGNKIDDENDWTTYDGYVAVYIDFNNCPFIRAKFTKSGITINVHKSVFKDEIIAQKYSENRTNNSDTAGYCYTFSKFDPFYSELMLDLCELLGIDHYRLTPYPEEDTDELSEGSKKMVYVNSYERNPEARRKCIEHYKSYKCQLCGFDSSAFYGEEFEGLIHVHHIIPLSERKGPYQVKPEEDLIPVCPNCHMILHSGIMKRKKYSLEDLKTIIKVRKTCQF